MALNYFIKLRIVFVIFVILSGSIFVYGYIDQQLWWLVVLSIILSGLQIFFPQLKWYWYPNVYLASYILISILGILYHLPSILVLSGVSCVLISWELSDLNPFFNLQKNLSIEQKKYHQYRYSLLFTSVGIGLFISTILSFIHLKIHFIAILVISLVTLFSLFRIFSLIKNQTI